MARYTRLDHHLNDYTLAHGAAYKYSNTDYYLRKYDMNKKGVVGFLIMPVRLFATKSNLFSFFGKRGLQNRLPGVELCLCIHQKNTWERMHLV